jgi:proline racemase
VSARLALHYARKEIGMHDPIVIESILDTRFTGQVVATTVFGPHDAVVPEVEGRAWITGRHEFLMDPSDPLKNGFIFR